MMGMGMKRMVKFLMHTQAEDLNVELAQITQEGQDVFRDEPKLMHLNTVMI